MTNTSGFITDHLGGGHTEAGMMCNWTIIITDPEYSQIRLQFERFDLDFWYVMTIIK